jgi:hypothetical protein
MRKRESELDILSQYLDEEILQQMPEWFRILRTAYRYRIRS